jgi:hypothetical protein
VYTSSPNGQDIPTGQDPPAFFGVTHHLEQLESPMSIENTFPSQYSPPIYGSNFHQHDQVNMASSGMQQFSPLHHYRSIPDYQDYTNGQDYSEAQSYDQNNNYPSHVQFNGQNYGDYGFDYQTHFDQ